MAVGVLKDLGSFPREPPVFQIGTPRGMSHVAAVWGLAVPGRPASSGASQGAFSPTRIQAPLAADDFTAASMNFMPASPSWIVG